MEEGGRIRRGYFVDGLGAAQFALPGAVDRLRSMRDQPGELAGERGRVGPAAGGGGPGQPVRRRAALAPARRRRPAAVPAGGRRLRGAGRRRGGRLRGSRRVLDPDAAGGRRSRRARPRSRVPARPRRRRPGARARDRQGRRRAGRRVADPRRADRRRVRRRLPRVRAAVRRRRRRTGRGLARRWSAPSARCPRATRWPGPRRDSGRTSSVARCPAAKARAPGPAGRPAGRLDGDRRRGDGQEPADPVRQRPRGPDAPPDARLVAPLPAGRGVAPAAGSRVARPGGAGLGRRVLRRPGGRAVRAADRGAPPVAVEARARTCSPTRSTSTRRCAACGRPSGRT